jgi:arylsulfatase A-like enzyme
MGLTRTSSRRDFLRNAALSSGAVIAATSEVSAAVKPPAARPNVLMICADQFRADFVGANHENPSVITPNIDALSARGTNFSQTICNQPLCSPSRASFLTSRYATETDVWKLELEMNHTLPTVATAFKQGGYTTAFVGKWHISAKHDAAGKEQLGWVPPGPSRGGFDDLWEGANVIELVSRPTEGNYWDNAGTNIGFRNQYRVDFITDRAVGFLEQKHDKPWLLFLSHLEPHHQNGIDAFVPPQRYAQSYGDAFVPQDLRNLPGNWRSHLQGYYGCVQAIDDCVGKLVATLEKTGQLANTIIVFFSDHGCTFKTRLGEYKRSPHESSLRVPLILAGPGFDRSTVVQEVVSLLDLTPTLLDAASVEVAPGMKGKALKPMLDDPAQRRQWNSEVYIQISQSIVGRAIRTKEWTYCAYDPLIAKGLAPFSRQYTDFALYSLAADPYQQVNLIGRPEYQKVAAHLRDRLKSMIVANGEPEATITPTFVYA